MLFWLKKVAGFWLMPLPLALALMTLGTLFLFSAKRARLGRRLLVGGFALLLIFSNRFVSRSLIQPLEMRHPAVPDLLAGAALPDRLAACKFIVVLGGGDGFAPGLAANQLLNSSSIARIVEGVRLAHALPEAKLILSGPTTGPVDSHATLLARTAIALGIHAGRIIRTEEARDTEEEVAVVQRLTNGAPIAVVTSAWHMPRAMALFHHHKIAALPCPTDYYSHTDGQSFIGDFGWELPALIRSTVAVRERIGYLWIWLRGKTSDAKNVSPL